ncbi:hypothetical protein DAMA08_026460 [Martiniozyma asiatica (nom. inval.)]|nr:hypothetical protein DAMA08_026460 [Martiniozyma asiatica]
MMTHVIQTAQLYGSVHIIPAQYFTRFGEIFALATDIDSYQIAWTLNVLESAEIANKNPVNSLKIWILSHGENHPNVISLYNTIFLIAVKFELQEEATILVNKLIELSDAVNGEYSVPSSLFIYQLCQFFFRDHKYELAIDTAAKYCTGLLKKYWLMLE